jgi:hypothetical protein
MFVSFAKLQESYANVSANVSRDGSIITVKNLPYIKNGRLGIKVSKGWSIRSFEKGSAEFVGPQSSMASEIIMEGVNIMFDVQEPRVSSVAMAGLTPAPVMCGRFLEVTICVATTHAHRIQSDAVNIVNKGPVTFALVTLDPQLVNPVSNDQYSLELATGDMLLFRFHKDIYDDAVVMLEKAWNDADILEGQHAMEQNRLLCLAALQKDAMKRRPKPLCFDTKPVGTTSSTSDVASYAPRLEDNVGTVTDGSYWDDHFTKDDAASGYNAFEGLSISNEVDDVAEDAVVLPRNIPATPFSGFEVMPSRVDKKNARRQAELQRLEQERLDTEEAQRLEQERLDTEDARLVREAEKAAELQSRQVSTGNTVSPVQEQPDGSETFIVIHTPHLNYLRGLQNQARCIGVNLNTYKNGNQWAANITRANLQKMHVSLRNQYLWVLARDGGYSVQVDRQSYNDLMAARPDCAEIVAQALQLQQLYNRKAVPAPMYEQRPWAVYIVPILGFDGTVVAYQQVPQVPMYA